MDDNGHGTTYRERLLITGAESVLGANLAVALSGRFQVLALVDSAEARLDGCRAEAWDPTDWEDLAARIRRESPHWVIHCGPLARGSWDDAGEDLDLAGEPRFWKRMAKASERLGHRLTVVSTDAVFAGPRMFHDERSAPDATTAFAKVAQRAEASVKSSGALVVRTHAYGWSPRGSGAGFAERAWQGLCEGAAGRFDVDRHATPILATDLAELLASAYSLGLQGLYHVTGAERSSEYRFARELAGAFGLSNSPASTDDQVPRGPTRDRLDETSLNTRKARRALESPMPMLREGLERFAEQAVNGFRDRLKASFRGSAVRGAAA
jgi:dTDP-4-dehydrorhamnose reductase